MSRQLVSKKQIFPFLTPTRPQAIEENILEWVSLLHVRTPLCTVMLVASHYDMLHGALRENEQLLMTLEERCVIPKMPTTFGTIARHVVI